MRKTPYLHFGEVEIDPYLKLRLETMVRMVSGKIRPGITILEIGCYTANLLDFLPKEVKYYGIDFDDGAIEIARKRGAKVIKIDFDQQEINLDMKFDVVVCCEVLEYVLEPHKLMRKITNLVKDDGYLLFSLPNENTLYHRLVSLIGVGIDMYAFELYKHLHLPTISQSRNFVSKYFKIIKEDYHINPSAKGSRIEWMGNFLTLLPKTFWLILARCFPGLFARGVIFLCKPK